MVFSEWQIEELANIGYDACEEEEACGVPSLDQRASWVQAGWRAAARAVAERAVEMAEKERVEA